MANLGDAVRRPESAGRIWVRPASKADIPDWAEMRSALWPSEGVEHHRNEIVVALDASDPDLTAFLALDETGATAGFVEAALRHDYVNGCETSPVAFLEGIYVRPQCRGEAIGRALFMAVEDWARTRGCTELASDARLENLDSHAFHLAVGFEETERVVCFRRVL